MQVSMMRDWFALSDPTMEEALCGITPMRTKVEHPFRVIKRQRGLGKVQFPGPAKNKAHVITLFALWNPWMPRRRLLANPG